MRDNSCKNKLSNNSSNCYRCDDSSCLQDCDKSLNNSEDAFSIADKHFDAALESIKKALCELEKWDKCQCVGNELLENDTDKLSNEKTKKCVSRKQSRNTNGSYNKRCNQLWKAAIKADTKGEMLTRKTKEALYEVLELLEEAERCFNIANTLANEADQCEHGIR